MSEGVIITLLDITVSTSMHATEARARLSLSCRIDRRERHGGKGDLQLVFDSDLLVKRWHWFVHSSPFNNNLRAPGQRGQQARNMGDNSAIVDGPLLTTLTDHCVTTDHVHLGQFNRPWSQFIVFTKRTSRPAPESSMLQCGRKKTMTVPLFLDPTLSNADYSILKFFQCQILQYIFIKQWNLDILPHLIGSYTRRKRILYRYMPALNIVTVNVARTSKSCKLSK